ncbi:MAG: 4Fe-4S binding protein [Bacteroidales bacterium]|nr:4Fe-4S binding protein [Bacteroidales bacterium]
MDTPLFSVIQKKCVSCYACVRVCPVKAIEVPAKNNKANILENRCIGCGQCLNVCPTDAIVFRSHKQITLDLLDSSSKVAAIVAPSISGEFHDITDYRKFVQMIKSLGFEYVNEVSFGADIVAAKYKDLFENSKGKYYLSANCPAIVQLIEKFHPELIDNLAPIASPMITSCKVVKQKYGKDTKVVYIGPCIANKEEIKRYDGEFKIDSVLTFTELRELFKEKNINESSLEYSEFDTPLGNKGSLYPISNGILQAAGIKEDLLTGNTITVRGRNSILDAARQFETSANQIQRHMNLFYCEGCLMGPGTTAGGERFIRRSRVIEYANKRLKEFDHDKWDKDIEKYSVDITEAVFEKNDQRIKEPTQEKINEILQILGKEEKDNHASGCGACGYESCEHFAVAVAKGLAKTDMCLTFATKNRQQYINTLKATNDKLSRMQNKLKDSEQQALKQKAAAEEANEINSSMLEKLTAGVIILNRDLKIIKSNNSFVRLLGQDAEEINEVIPGLVGADLKTLLPFSFYNLFTYVLKNDQEIINRDVPYNEGLLNISVFTIKKHNIVGAVIRDMYAPDVRKEEVINRVTEVIDKNLEMVQKIGFLLGEGASETEQMLNSIIQSYKTGKSPERK